MVSMIMSKWTFQTFQQHVLHLYHAQEYIQAFELVEREQATFPEHAHDIASADCLARQWEQRRHDSGPLERGHGFWLAPGCATVFANYRAGCLCLE